MPRFAGGAERVIDLAHVGRAKLEAQARVDANGVEKLAADEFDPGDVGLGCADILLDERDAVDRVFELVAVDIGRERVDALKKLDAQTLAGAVVLKNDRIANGRASLGNVFAANRGNGGRGLDAETGQTLLLRNLGYF